MDNLSHESCWLAQLVSDVQEAYHLRISQRQFTSSSYGIIIPSGASTFSFRNERRNLLDRKTLRAQVLATVDAILQFWLGYPAPDQCHLQAWLVHVLLMEFGRPVLYLNSVWKTYTEARRGYIDTQYWNISSFKDVRPLQQAAANHPLSNTGSPESKALQDLANLFDSFMAGKLDGLPLAEEEREGGTTDHMPYQLECIKERKVQVFAKFVMDSLSIFLQVRQGEVDTKLKNRMGSNLDKLLPFREHAPSRHRIRGSEGPFTAAYARTTPGAYSAAVWRGVTFGTSFSMNNRMVFTSYDDFKSACKDAGAQEKSYFCDKGAYGPSNPMRKIELAELYWKTLATGKWTDFVDDRIVPFMECYQFFMAGQTPPDFPQLGILASYLLTADFSYCHPKVVESPTLQEMASLIRSLNKGAISALENLGFITPREVRGKKPGKANLEETELALRRVYDLLKKIIPGECQEIVNLDLIMTEHTLCKFSRAIHWKVIEQL